MTPTRGRLNRVHPEVVDPWLRTTWDADGTDLMLTSGSAPRMRVGGRLRPIGGEATLTGEAIEGLLRELIGADVMDILQERDIDFAFSWRQVARVRGNAFMQRGEPAVALRLIPARIPTIEELGLPPVDHLGGRPAPGPQPDHRSDR